MFCMLHLPKVFPEANIINKRQTLGFLDVFSITPEAAGFELGSAGSEETVLTTITMTSTKLKMCRIQNNQLGIFCCSRKMRPNKKIWASYP